MWCARMKRLGLIPACAGKTTATTGGKEELTAHPRVCGENLPGDQPPRPALGSSPRVRGKRNPRLRPERITGLIPACAGKTVGGGMGPVCGAAHPRVCGENAAYVGGVSVDEGSSPRVRGKPRRDDEQGVRVGLIPACAGKTAFMNSVTTGSRAHPRVCGENRVPVGVIAGHPGSSPRVRGKLMTSTAAEASLRLIPACAGKTSPPVSSPGPSPAHPRVCGENTRRSAHQSVGQGSSPRVRGKRRHSGDRGLPVRLIPACAGKTGRPSTG